MDGTKLSNADAPESLRRVICDACEHPGMELVVRQWREEDAPVLGRAVRKSLDWARVRPRPVVLRVGRLERPA
jgi:hypothetical protein